MIFDRTRLKIRSLKEREHDLDISIIKPLLPKDHSNRYFTDIAQSIIAAREKDKEIILMMGGHVVRAGVQRYLIDLLEKGYLTCLAMNGSCAIHDFELSFIGATTENVARYLSEGQFGLWKETSRINDIVNLGYKDDGLGMGRSVGKAIYEGDFPHKNISLLATCYRLNIPATVHVSIGYDIIHEHPNFDGAAAGAASYLDFLQLADIITRLEGGVIMNFGSAIMAPEVFLKALSMARNVAHQEGRVIQHFTTLVCDLHELPDFKKEPPEDDPAYYFRPWKTMLVRAVADGGESLYIKGRHEDTIPALWTALERLK